MNPNTKKITPISTRFNDEKRGDNSVKDMSVSKLTIKNEYQNKNFMNDLVTFDNIWRYMLYF